MEKRRYKRLDTKLIVKIKSGRRIDTLIMKKILDPKIKNISYGGIYIETPTPFRANSSVELVFWLPNYKEQIYAKGIVRWSNTDTKPIGMGIEFVEVSTNSKQIIDEYVDSRIKNEVEFALTQTPFHTIVLKHFSKNIGNSQLYDDFLKETSLPPHESEEILKPFIIEGLISKRDNLILFNQCANQSLVEIVNKYCNKQ